MGCGRRGSDLREVGEDQLEIDNLDVAQGVDRACSRSGLQLRLRLRLGLGLGLRRGRGRGLGLGLGPGPGLGLGRGRGLGLGHRVELPAGARSALAEPWSEAPSATRERASPCLARCFCTCVLRAKHAGVGGVGVPVAAGATVDQLERVVLLAFDRTCAALLLGCGPERQLLLQGAGACSGILELQAVRHASLKQAHRR